MANELSFLDLVLLGYELCGTYRLCIDSEFASVKKGFVDGCEPLTTPNHLARALAALKGISGLAIARRAAQYVVAGSRSPKESQLAMRFGMPLKYGAYGLGLPNLNWQLDVPRDRRYRYNKPYYLLDLYWDDAKVDIEYDSSLAHSGTWEADSVRRNDIESLGVHVVVATPALLANADMMDRVAEDIAKRQGRRIQPRSRDYFDQRLAFHQWTIDYRRIGMASEADCCN